MKKLTLEQFKQCTEVPEIGAVHLQEGEYLWAGLEESTGWQKYTVPFAGWRTYLREPKTGILWRMD